jgi:hypothetical protein
LHDLDLCLPPDFLVLGDDAFGVRGTALDKVCTAVLHNAGCNRHLGDCVGPVHLHDCIMARGIGPGCIENLSIAHRLIAPIAPIDPSRRIVLAMTLFTLASICMADSRSSRVSNDRR